MPRISMFVHDLHSNPISRAAPFARSLQGLGFEIEVLGLLPPGRTVYAPYADLFEYKTIEITGRISRHARELARIASGDVCYAFKPFRTTLLPAMMAAGFGKQKPVLFDIEDDDLKACQWGRSRRILEGVKSLLKNPMTSLAIYTHALRHRCVQTTVSTSYVQRFYGGTILLNGPDERDFDPDSACDKTTARRRFGLPTDRHLVLFAGGPAYHKGFDLIVDAVSQSNADLVLAGNPDKLEFREAKAALEKRCHLVGLIPHHEISMLLTAVDVVPVPQRDVPYGRTQLPTKLLDAMAMAKPVIVTDVGDLPKLIGSGTENASGWLVPNNNSQALAAAIEEIQSNPNEAARRSKNARKFFLENASFASNRELFRKIFAETPRLRPLLPTC